MSLRHLVTSESVSEGHPDKICDRIADSILDVCLEQDPSSHTAIEVMAIRDRIIIAGEVTSKAKVDYEKIARDTVRQIGYTDAESGIDPDTMAVELYIERQSPDIAMGVDAKGDKKLGAGDQGMMFGYATDETENLMPLPIVMAHKLVRYATTLRKEGLLPFARPDMKSQVTIDYTDKKPKLNAVVFSMQHDKSIDIEELRKIVREKVLFPVIDSFGISREGVNEYYVNPTGRFEIGGPRGDTGMTGRKIIVDTYGGRVDRSAAYAARHAAKNIVAAGLASKCLIQLSYAIGVSEPVSIALETYGTEKVKKEKILAALCDTSIFDFTPQGIIDRFHLTAPSFHYRDLSAYGHFGRPDLLLPYELLDKVDALKKLFQE